MAQERCAILLLPYPTIFLILSLHPSCPRAQHYNTVIADATGSNRALKFGLRDAGTKEPLHWSAPAAVARGGIQKVLERAQLLQDSAAAAAP